MKISLSKKIYFIIFSFFILFSLVATFTVYSLSRSEIEALEKENLKNIAREQEQEVSLVFDSAEDDLLVVSTHPELSTFIANPDSEELRQLVLDDFIHHNVLDKYSAIYMMDSSGLTLVSTDPSFENNNYSFRDYFKGALQGKLTIDVGQGVTSNTLGYYVAGPVMNHNTEEVVGVLVFKLRPDVIHTAFKEDTADINNMFVDQFGVVIFSNDNDKQFSSLGQITEQEKEQIDNSKRYNQLSIESLDYEVAQKFIRSKNNIAVFDFFDNYDNDREVLGIVKLENREFYVLLEASYDIISSAAVRIAQRISLLVILFSIFISLFILFFIAKLLKPLKTLEKSIDELEKGDLSHRTKIKTGDELEEIGEGFNAMADRLQANIENIEKEVHDRTSSLEKLNKHMIGRELRMVELKNELKKYKKEEDKDNLKS